MIDSLQLWPTLDTATEAALRASIERWGVLVPVARDQHGRVIDGHHRARIADELGVRYPVLIHTVADDDEAQELARTLNSDRRQLTVEQRRDMVAHLRAQGHSYRAIGQALGVSHVQAREDASTGNHLPVAPERIVGLDGKSRPAKRPASVFAKDASEADRVAPQLASMVDTATGEVLTAWDVTNDSAPALASPARDGSGLAVHFTSDSPEWYTPTAIIARAVTMLGAIDLDPCSPGRDVSIVPAARHFTRADNGLSQPWGGRVYMNPPYGREIAEWVARLVSEYRAGRVTEALALVPARTDTEWMAALREYPRCYIRGRLSFSGHENAAPFPSVVVYLGPQLGRFVEAFGDAGDIYQLVTA